MIVENTESCRAEREFMWDVGRPSMYTEDSLIKWTKFHQLVEHTDIKIRVNSMFKTLYKECLDGQRSLGGGMKYCFWFESEQDMNNFSQAVDAIFDTLNTDPYDF